MKTIQVKAEKPYPVYIQKGLLKTSFFSDFCQTLKRSFVMITDSHVKARWGLHLQQHWATLGLDVSLLSFPAGEINKTRETKATLEDQLLQLQCGRDVCLIALGGGVVLDLVGFLAATYCRGVPVIYIPTTLLAMVDACIGGKTGVNTPAGKNLIGTISSPLCVLMDVDTLTTLPQIEWRNGIVEMIKHALLNSAAQFSLLHELNCEITDTFSDILFENCFIKKIIVEQDETEQGIRQLLNLGHTIGHAIEVLENFTLSHGEAVAIGLLVEGYMAVRMGLLKQADLEAIERLLRQYQLPLKTRAFANRQKMMDLLVLDKKTRAKMPRFVLLESIAHPYQVGSDYAHAVDKQLLLDALEWGYQHFQVME